MAENTNSVFVERIFKTLRDSYTLMIILNDFKKHVENRNLQGAVVEDSFLYAHWPLHKAPFEVCKQQTARSIKFT